MASSIDKKPIGGIVGLPKLSSNKEWEAIKNDLEVCYKLKFGCQRELPILKICIEI